MKSPEIVVIGAGPAGMMAAGFAAAQGAKVTLLEKNKKPGRKLMITGKGRCNITNFCDNDTFISNLTANPRFMYSAVNSFSPYDTVDFFNSLGLPTKLERGGRIFPESDKAKDVADALFDFATRSGAKFRVGEAKSLLIENGSVKGVRTTDGDIICDRVIVATGGLSYRATGCTGDGYRFAESAGHKVTELMPSLVPLVSEDDFCAELQGLTLKNIGFQIIDNKNTARVYSDFGELLFTHFGISGPVALSASAHMREMSKGRYRAVIDLKPALDEETLDKRILRDLSEFSRKDIGNSLFELLPKRMIPVILKRAAIDPHMKCSSLDASARKRLLALLKSFDINISSFRPLNEAIVTHGGVDVREISPKTMESKLISGLYFCGEVLDVDAYTGGFNLQIAFSTGRLAGLSSACI